MEKFKFTVSFDYDNGNLEVFGDSPWGKELNKFKDITMDNIVDLVKELSEISNRIGISPYHTEQMIYEVEND